jgi:putative endonuclease
MGRAAMTPKETGDFGERIAAEFLRSKGFEIIGTNYHSRFGEIDIIAANSEFVVFAEVKTRKNAGYGTAGEYVDFRKQEKLRVTAEQWLQERQDVELQPRFDVIEVYTQYAPDSTKPAVRWLTNAF